MMRNLFYWCQLIFFGISITTFAGDNGGGNIKCRSASGKTLLEGMAGVASHNGQGPADLVYRIEDKEVHLQSSRYLDQENTHLTDFVLFEAPRSYYLSFVISTQHQGWANDGDPNDVYIFSRPIFTMSSLPGSMKKLSGDQFRFVAKIHAYSVDPRKTATLGKEITTFDKEIVVNCDLDLSL